MDSLSPFATHFARLVWLLSQRPQETEEHKEELRQTLSRVSSERQHLVLHDVSLAVSSAVSAGEPSESLIWFGELSVRMSSHSVRALEFDAATPAREIMEVARALAAMPRPGDQGEAIDEALVAIGLTGVTAHIGPMGFIRRAVAQDRDDEASSPSEIGLPGFSAEKQAKRQLDRPTPVVSQAIRRSSAEAQLMHDQLMPLAKPSEGAIELLDRLDKASTSANPMAIVDDVARATEDRARQGQVEDLLQIMHRMHEHLAQLHDGDTKRAFLMGTRRLERPALMHSLARLLPSRRDLRDSITRILAHAGDTGADALIDNLISSDVATERRAYRDALGNCPAATGALVHLLEDERWYVVRNAVELLGELESTEADAQLASQLSHREPRVRRAVAMSLGRMRTSRSVLALLQALNDPSPDVRLQVAHALGAAKNPKAVPWLIEALDAESDPDVQASLVAALGQTPTEDAVARLSRAAEAGGVLRRKPTVLRLRAVDALGEAGTPGAKEVLRGLLNDRDREVRDAAHAALSRHAPDRL